VISPLPHRIEQQSLFGMQDPFERQVTRFLSEGLHAIVEASEYALRKASTDHFRETITVGVSANLLDAVLGLMGSNRHAVGVNFAWSPELPAVDVPVDTITFDPDFAPVIQEASKFLKQQEPSPPVDLLGVVVALRRPEGVDQGRATLLSFIDSRPRHVNLELTQEFYDVAILAHRERRPVTCRGELMRLGRVIVLAKITRFDLAPEEGDAEEPPALFPSET
jgi:hypothetical protein